jgi:hypothetical protein
VCGRTKGCDVSRPVCAAAVVLSCLLPCFRPVVQHGFVLWVCLVDTIVCVEPPMVGKVVVVNLPRQRMCHYALVTSASQPDRQTDSKHCLKPNRRTAYSVGGCSGVAAVAAILTVKSPCHAGLSQCTQGPHLWRSIPIPSAIGPPHMMHHITNQCSTAQFSSVSVQVSAVKV